MYNVDWVLDWVHCGVAPLGIPLLPAGRDWVLLVTFWERLGWREPERVRESGGVTVGKLRLPTCHRCQRRSRDTSVCVCVCRIHAWASVSTTASPWDEILFSVVATTLRSPWKMVRTFLFFLSVSCLDGTLSYFWKYVCLLLWFSQSVCFMCVFIWHSVGVAH